MFHALSRANRDLAIGGVLVVLTAATSALGVCYTQGGTVNCCSLVTAGGPNLDHGCGLLSDHPCADQITSNPAVQRVIEVTTGKSGYSTQDGFQCKWRVVGCDGWSGTCATPSTTESTAGCASNTPSGDNCQPPSGGGGPFQPVGPPENS